MNATTPIIPVPVASSKGYLRPSILWHLLEEGTATLADLQRLIGSPRHSIERQLRCMRTLGQVQHSTCLAPRMSGGRVLGLTPAGNEAALRVDRRDVECAS
ncbi:MAG: hypothetical protein Q8J78_08015 [Moraxellaceae bacterium]|nr:hypothetical protein [Moraxellaceae bacterium]